MKPLQLFIAMVVLAGMVFLITVGMNYVPDTNRSAPSKSSDIAVLDKTSPQLTFMTTRYPPMNGSIREWEHKKPGFADYWFENTFDVPIKLGLIRMNCKCSGVELYLATSEWQARRLQAARVVHAGHVAGPICIAFAALEEAALTRADDAMRVGKMEAKDEGLLVPAHAVGWVRCAGPGKRKMPRPSRPSCG